MSPPPLKSPCTRDCPNRSAVPNCHNADICEKWARYLVEKDEDRKKRLDYSKKHGDIIEYSKHSYVKHLRREHLARRK